jgi:hypothetical protein
VKTDPSDTISRARRERDHLQAAWADRRRELHELTGHRRMDDPAVAGRPDCELAYGRERAAYLAYDEARMHVVKL